VVSRFLLDVNVLIALHSPEHVNFQSVQQWFHTDAINSFATCAVTQAGFLRLSPRFSIDSNVGLEEAKTSLARLSALPGHEFWSMDEEYLAATALFESRIRGHQQITDAYLLGLSIRRNGRLATLDRGILHLAGPEFLDSVELVA
jgi:uncharacterized protein